MEFYHNIGALI